MTDILQRKIDERIAQNALRKLIQTKELIDFSSNDYLGFASSKELKKLIEQKSKEYDFGVGSTGARLLSGNSEYVEELERQIASLHGASTGLIFNSGYLANLGLFSSVPQRGDTIIYDEYIHASIRDGIRLSNANSFSFSHNDLKI